MLGLLHLRIQCVRGGEVMSSEGRAEALWLPLKFFRISCYSKNCEHFIKNGTTDLFR